MAIVDSGMEELLETFIHETDTMLEQLDDILLDSERAKSISEENINTIFRITHTIKGSAAMMGFGEISNLAHSVEDVFYILRETPEKLSLVFETLFDLVFQTSDFLKKEMGKFQEDTYTPGDPSALIGQLKELVAALKNGAAPAAPAAPAAAEAAHPPVPGAAGKHRLHVYFEDDCQMENMRAFMLLTQLQHCCASLTSVPEQPETNSELSAEIIKNGLWVYFEPNEEGLEEVTKTVESALNIKSYELLEPEAAPAAEAVAASASAAVPSAGAPAAYAAPAAAATATMHAGAKQNLISVNQVKLDHLMDLVGELVTAESMVARNPDLKGLRLDNFHKSVRELRKLTDELQDIVMSIRMVPLMGTFRKMERIVRDMSKKLEKKAELRTEGGDTEVDKTINDAIADPLMHMIRNSMDHAIELPAERLAAGKPEMGTVTLSAKNVGGEIVIKIIDDGAGLDPAVLLKKARERGLLTKPESAYSDREIWSLIMLPGFSTNTAVTEYSGRGVGMDVVRKNIEQVGGKLSITSVKGEGTTFTITIPLTLAIVDGMNLSVGSTIFTLPITAIQQSFRVSDAKQLFTDSNGNEMIMVRGECLPVLRLHQLFGLTPKFTDAQDGIMILVESSHGNACLFADELLGEYQVVVKPFSAFLNKYKLKENGLSGCSILGDGSISLILDTNSLLDN